MTYSFSSTYFNPSPALTYSSAWGRGFTLLASSVPDLRSPPSDENKLCSRGPLPQRSSLDDGIENPTTSWTQNLRCIKRCRLGNESTRGSIPQGEVHGSGHRQG